MSNMVVQTNVLALNAHRNIKVVGNMQSKASQKLSSGYRINNAADDAAGLAISEKMRSQIRGLDMASKNAADGQSLINTAEGGLQEIDNMLQRIRELTVQASNDTNDQQSETELQGDRRKIQDEIDSLTSEIDSMAERVEFNKKKVISGAYSDGETAESLFGASSTSSTNASSTAQTARQELRNYTKAELAELKSLATAIQNATAAIAAAMGTHASAATAAEQLSVLAAAVYDAIDSGKTGNALDNAIARAYKNFVDDPDVAAFLEDASPSEKSPIESFLNSLRRDEGVAAKINLINVVKEETASDKTAAALAATAGNLLTSILTDGIKEKDLNNSLSLLAAALTTDTLYKDNDGSVGRLLDAFGKADPRLTEKTDLIKAVAKSVASNGAASSASVAAMALLKSIIVATEVDATLLSSLSSVATSLLANGSALSGDNSVTKLLDAFGNAGLGGLKPYTDLIKAAIGNGLTTASGSAEAEAFIASILGFGPNMTLDQLNEAIGDLDAAGGMASMVNPDAGMALRHAAQEIYKYQRNGGTTEVWSKVTLADDAYRNYIADPEDTNDAENEVGANAPAASGSAASKTGTTSLSNVRPNANALFFQVGANADQGIYVNIRSVKTDTLGIGDGSGTSKIDVMKTTGDQITKQLDTLDRALTFVTSERAKLGAVYNRLEYTQKSLDISSENLSAAESRIRDTDMAKEMMSFTKSNVLNQAGISMLSQANQAPQNILSLLR